MPQGNVHSQFSGFIQDQLFTPSPLCLCGDRANQYNRHFLMDQTNENTPASTVTFQAFELPEDMTVFHPATVALLEMANHISTALVDLGSASFEEPKRKKGEKVLDYSHRVVEAEAAFNKAQASEPAFIKGELNGLFQDFGSEFFGKSSRTKISEAMRDQVVQLSKDGKTIAEIAAELCISVPSVSNIRKERGITKDTLAES